MKTFKNDNLIVGASPHLVDSLSTRKIMGLVSVALLPSLLVSTYVYGLRCIILAAVTIVASVFFEYLFAKITKRENTIDDLSAVVTGLLLAMNLPPNFPYWMAVVGAFVAIVIVKQLFGGLGQNFVNPAITARIVLFVGFASQMSAYQDPSKGRLMFSAADAVTGATPLQIANVSGYAEAVAQYPTMQLFLGNIGGSMGEVSALALLIGGIFLIIKKVISPATPIAFLGTMAVFALLIGQDPLWHICAGGAMIGAFFMATDYVTTPITIKGKIVFGICCGLLTMIIRTYGAYPEGISFSILLMNIITPLIDSFFEKRLYGGGKK